jgi:hypothetical protein
MPEKRLMQIFGEEKMEEHGKKALQGLEAGMEIDFKRVLAGEADKDADLRADLAYLTKMMVYNGSRIMNAGAAAAEAFSLEMSAQMRDTGLSRYRKEVKGELRDEELEEQRVVSMNEAVQQASGVNAQMGSANLAEAITGAIEYLMATGILKAVSETEAK